jgi:hypothetical protein
MKSMIRTSVAENAEAEALSLSLQRRPRERRAPRGVTAMIAMVVLAGVSATRGSVLVQDTFSYPDGSVTAVSGGLWLAYSEAGNGPVMVNGGQLKIDFWNLEDVSIALPGAPYDTVNNQGVATLYCSFTLTCARLPRAPTGTYFAYFKDSGPRLTRCRVFALTNGAAPGTYRLAIGSTNDSGLGAAAYPINLTTNTAYSIVTRLDLMTGESALWINPLAENNFAATNVPPNPGELIGIAAYAFRQARHQSGVMLVDNFKIGTRFSDLMGANAAPLISEMHGQRTARNVSLGPIPFTVFSTRVAAASLSVSAFSFNAALVPNTAVNLHLTGNDSNRFLTIVPATNVQGAGTITVSVSDGLNTSSTAFPLTVGAPVISAIPDQLTVTNVPLVGIPFTVFDAESDRLTFSVASSDTFLLPTNNIALTGSGSNYTVSLTPYPDQNGVAVVTIGVTDGINTNATSFRLGVSPRLGLLFSEPFAYAAAPAYSNTLTALPNSLWLTASGVPFQIKLTNHAVALCYSNTEGAGASISGGPYSPLDAITFYAGFTVNFSALPFTNGGYFFMFKGYDTDVLHFRGKVFARTRNASSGHFRLGIANSDDAPMDFPVDLNLNMAYQVVVAHNAGLGESALWVNPISEHSPQVLASDVPRPVDIGGIGLRQTKGMGKLAIGPIKVGTAFSDVFTMPLAESLGIRRFGTNIVLSWSNSIFGLAASTDLPDVSSRIPGASSPWTNPATGQTRYFRLVYP